MNKIRFSSDLTVRASPLVVHFAIDTSVHIIRFSDDYKQHTSPLSINFINDAHTPSESIMAEFSLGFNTLSVVRVESDFAYKISTHVTSNFELSYHKQVNTEFEFSIDFSCIDSIENTIKIAAASMLSLACGHHLKWCASDVVTTEMLFDYVNAKVCEQSLIISYAPSSQNYICYRVAHPAAGKLHITFNKEHQQTTPFIRLSIPEKVCFWGVGGGPVRSDDDIPAIDTKIPIEPQLQRAYIMQPTIMCERLSDAQTILISQFSYAISRAQFSATGSIKFCSRIDMERAINQELKLTINGYEFIVICEQPSTSHKFANSSFSASIRSRFALLSAPYVTTTNYTNTVDKTMAGVMSDILVNTGWTLDNQMVDYPVPKGAFSYRDLTPATALLKVAKSIGAILDVDNINRVVSIVPEWPVNPWNTSNATCDVILNDSLIIEHNTRQTISPEFTAVFVRGEQQGVACKIKRQDTTASDYARDIVDSLITDNQAARQRGTCELARSGNKQESTIRTKLLDTLPPVRPGMLVGIRYTDSLYKATCDSVTLSASINSNGAITVNQTLKVISNV